MSQLAELFDESHCEQCACGEGLSFSFSFAFQPIVDVESRSVHAHEALVRGPSGEGAMDVLSKVNNRNRYTFDQICRVKAVKLAARLGMQSRLSINFMPNAVYQAEYCIRTTLAAAKSSGFEQSKLIFEVVETDELTSPEHLASIFEAYKNMGFQTALDDFGVGASPYNLMVLSPPDLLKIDMAIIRDVDTQPNKQAVVGGIIEMMNKLGGRIIAEGVETEAEYRWLRAQGITLYQGFLFARPGFESLPGVYFPD